MEHDREKIADLLVDIGLLLPVCQFPEYVPGLKISFQGRLVLLAQILAMGDKLLGESFAMAVTELPGKLQGLPGVGSKRLPIFFVIKGLAWALKKLQDQVEFLSPPGSIDLVFAVRCAQ